MSAERREPHDRMSPEYRRENKVIESLGFERLSRELVDEIHGVLSSTFTELQIGPAEATRNCRFKQEHRSGACDRPVTSAGSAEILEPGFATHRVEGDSRIDDQEGEAGLRGKRNEPSARASLIQALWVMSWASSRLPHHL